MLSALLVALSGIACGCALGAVFGFSTAAHRDSASGFGPSTNSAFLRFLTRPTTNLTFTQGAAYFVFLLVAMALYVVLLALPISLADRLTGDGPPLATVAFVFLFGSTFPGFRIGRRIWRKVS